MMRCAVSRLQLHGAGSDALSFYRAKSHAAISIIGNTALVLVTVMSFPPAGVRIVFSEQRSFGHGGGSTENEEVYDHCGIYEH